MTIAISINRNYAPAYSTRGLVFYYIKEFESAEKDFQQPIRLDDKDPGISNNYGWFLCNTGGRVRESIPYFQRVLKNSLYKSFEVGFLSAGTCHLKLDEVELAEELCAAELALFCA